MAHWRIRLQLKCSTAANATTVKNAIAVEMTGRSRFSTWVDLISFRATEPKTGILRTGVAMDVRFVNRADADDIESFVTGSFTGAVISPLLLVGSKVFKHLCPHADEVQYDCRTHSSFVVTEKT